MENLLDLVDKRASTMVVDRRLLSHYEMKMLFIGLFVSLSSMAFCQQLELADYINIKVQEYERKGEKKISIQPELSAGTPAKKFERRFLYLILNIPEIYTSNSKEKYIEMKSYYPDTMRIANTLLKEYDSDPKLKSYFNQTLEPIIDPESSKEITFSSGELLEVASKFFYCDKVKPDTSIQAHVCVGLNGIKEANWEQDYTLLQAFCFEAIFYGIMDNKDSKIWDAFTYAKQQSSEFHRPTLSSLDQYLEDVKLDLFERMRTNETLERELLAYYEQTRETLAFSIED
ncbi:hypothetical protein [Marinoscillum sp. 108]|uniref:hypothetical protein n=1 Tax=Marinoscillum sp. 108 TaxID=2653151 RepID=UPI0012F44FCC|nr:hypothetical protein [Marinoscillum sp. 108]VXD11162.1 conserved hypothetical protein [Marinoscillum sp. 108]